VAQVESLPHKHEFKPQYHQKKKKKKMKMAIYRKKSKNDEMLGKRKVD
jgi:hypothetical protein